MASSNYADSVCTPELAGDERGRALVSVAFGMWFLSMVAVGFRFLSRHLAGTIFWWDDWMILVSLLLCGGYSFSSIPLYLKGMGKHVQCAEPDAVEFWLKTLLAWEFLYTVVIVTTKYSILLFLWRLFSVSRQFRFWFWILWTTVTLWGIAIIITSALSCIPLHAFWGEGTGRCVNVKAFYVGNAVPNIVTDVALLVLPIPWIMQLKISRVARVSLAGVFACGALVVAISAYRLYVLMSTDTGPDVTYNDAYEAMWTIIEDNVAILSACLPIMSPLVKKLLGFLRLQYSQYETSKMSSYSG